MLVSKELIDKSNEIKRRGKLPAFNIHLELNTMYYEYGTPKPRIFSWQCMEVCTWSGGTLGYFLER